MEQIGKCQSDDLFPKLDVTIAHVFNIYKGVFRVLIAKIDACPIESTIRYIRRLVLDDFLGLYLGCLESKKESKAPAESNGFDDALHLARPMNERLYQILYIQYRNRNL
jgi:hypothetical protein